jgi:RNA polymerase sigma-B factor
MGLTEVRSPAAEDERLFRRWREDGDPTARDELFTRYRPLAKGLALRFRRVGDDADDAQQVACLALVKALNRFDVDRGLRFSSYAVPTILGELKRHLRDTTWALGVPRDLHDLAMRIEATRRRLEGTLGRTPSVAELAEGVGASLETTLEACHALSTRTVASLDRPARDDVDLGLANTLGVEDPGLAGAERRALLDGLIRTLPERERELLRLRFEEDMTQSDIAARIGVSQMHVSRLLRRCIARLEELADAPAPAGDCDAPDSGRSDR